MEVGARKSEGQQQGPSPETCERRVQRQSWGGSKQTLRQGIRISDK